MAYDDQDDEEMVIKQEIDRPDAAAKEASTRAPIPSAGQATESKDREKAKLQLRLEKLENEKQQIIVREQLLALEEAS